MNFFKVYALLIVKVYSKFKRFKAWGTAATVCSLLLLLTGCTEVPKVESTDFMMDTFVTQVWQGENADECYEEIIDMLTEGENLLSTFKEDSEIYRINEMSGKESVKVSSMTFDILSKSKEFSQKAKGKFDITIAPLVKLWDVTGNDPHVPSKESIDLKKSLINYEKLLLDKENKQVFLEDEGMEIDLGAVLKGYFAEEALKIAEEKGVSGYISVGGDVAVAGKKPDGSNYTVGLRNPRGEGNDYIGTLSMEGLTMATAGDYERYFIKDGKRYHHILDPFTGYPCETDIISATVLSKNGILADFLSTYIFMEGTENLERFENHEEFQFLVIDRDKNVYESRGFKDVFTPSEDKKEFNFTE